MISIIFGILLYFKSIYASPGLIDVSQFKSNKIFSNPTKLGEALFYKYFCDDACNHTNVFDGDFKLFPTRSHTKLVGLVLGVKNEDLQLVQVMYSDVKNDYHLNNMFYRKSEGHWEVLDDLTYKAELSTLKNNFVSFDINKTENEGFNKLNLTATHGYDSYTPKEGFEMDKVFAGQNLVWQSEPFYDFKSLDVTQNPEGPDRLRLNYSNYFSDVAEYYKWRSGRWTFDMGRRELDLLSLSTHGWKRRKESLASESVGPDQNFWLDQNEDFDKKEIRFKGSDLCDLQGDNPLNTLYFNMNFEKKDTHDLTVYQYITYEIKSYELMNLTGCRLNSVYDAVDDFPVFEFVPGSGEIFHDLKVSLTEDYPVLAISLTTLKLVDGACDPVSRTCKEAPYTQKNYFFKKNEEGWSCLELRAYYYELNQMLEHSSTLAIKKIHESPPVTPTLTPSTPNLDYGGKETFTYDINNPFETKFKQEILFTDPDLIQLIVKPEYVLNVIVDGQYLLWEQKENGSGCQVIYIYRSDTALLSHLVIDSEKENHLFFRHTGQRWVPTTKEFYEKSKEFYKGFKYLLKKPKLNFDEYTLPTETSESSDSTDPSHSTHSAHSNHSTHSDDSSQSHTHNNKNNNPSDSKMDALSSLDLTPDALNYIKSASKSPNV